MDICHSGQEALDFVVGNRKPDLILLDIMMPLKNGFDICRDIREKYSAEELPIILISAKNRDSDIKTGVEVGANDYIKKPVIRDELIIRVRQQIDLYDAKAKEKKEKFMDTEFAKIVAHLGEMRYIKADQSVCQLVFDSPLDKQLEINTSIGKIDDYFKTEKSLVRLQRSYIANPCKINRIVRDGSIYKAIFNNSSESISLGRTYLKTVRSKHSHLFEK